MPFHKAGSRSSTAATATASSSGVRRSLVHGQAVVSTGAASFDHLLGGGLAVGTVLLIEEDDDGDYAAALLRMFVSTGLVHRQPLFLATPHRDPAALLHACPAPVAATAATAASAAAAVVPQAGDSIAEAAEEEEEEEDAQAAALSIAWRYSNLPQVESTLGASASRPGAVSRRSGAASDSFCPAFDLGTKLDPAEYAGTLVDLFDVRSSNDASEECLRRMQQHCKAVAAAHAGSVSRLVVQGLGSPLWDAAEASSSSSSTRLCRFLLRLRALVRQSSAVALVTVPTHLLAEPALRTAEIERLSDTAVRLQAFAATSMADNPAVKDYHGLFRVQKLPRLNGISTVVPETLDLAFKLRRTGLRVEKLHLPPDLGDTVSRGDDTATSADRKMLCQPNVTKVDPLAF